MAGQAPSVPVVSLPQPPKDDAAIVGAVRLLSVLIAALTMDLAGRKILLFVSGELRPVSQSYSFTPSAAATSCASPCGGRPVAGSSGGPG